MVMRLLTALMLSLLLSTPGAVTPGLAAPDPVRVIFDTDMDTDCDDAGALAMLHALADRGEAEILATMVSSRYPYSAPTVDAINTYYGHPDLPIGVPKGPGATLDRTYRYPKQIAATAPHDLPANEAAPDAVALYRQILARQPDTSVVLVTVGYLTNIRHLLESAADASSPLSGKELVRQKVKRWIVMGGRYPEGLDPGVYGNFKPDPESAVVAVRHWPRPIVFSGVGGSIMTGSSLAQTPPTNPVRRAYELYLGTLEKERPSWDQAALLYAVRGAEPFWREHRQGYNRIFDNGTNQWRARPDTDQVRIVLKAPPSEAAAVIERLMSRPPPRR